MVKKMMMTLMMSIFGIIGFGFAMPNCLENFSDTEIQRMDTIKTVLKTNSAKFEKKFPGANVEIQKFIEKINNTQSCTGGYGNFGEFNMGIKKFVQALISQKLITTKNSDPEYDLAIANLQKNFGEFFSFGMKRNNFDYYNFDQNINVNFSSKNTDNNNYQNINIEGNFTTNGKGSQKNLKTDSTIQGKIYGSIDNNTTFGDKNVAQKGDGSIDFDAKVQINDKDLYFTLNNLNTKLNIDDPFVSAIVKGQFKAIKDKIGNKTIHIPLPEKLFEQHSKNILLMKNPNTLDFVKVVNYGNKKTIALGTQFCEFTSRLDNQGKKGVCLSKLKSINDELHKISKIKKITNDKYELVIKDEGGILTIVWDKNEITTIKGNIDKMTIHYENKYLNITVPEKVKITGKRDSKNGINLNIKDINQHDGLTINGTITTSAYEIKANMHIKLDKSSPDEDRKIEQDMNIDVKIKNIFNKINNFSIQTPKDIIEIKELEKLLDM